MTFLDELPSEDQTAAELAAELKASGNLHPLIARLRDGEVGPERARDALRILGELDLDHLVQITLDSLIGEYVTDPGLAHQPRRVVRSEQADED